MSSLKDNLQLLAELGEAIPTQPAPPPGLSGFAFPVVRRTAWSGGEPLRRNIDYQSTARKALLVEDLLLFYCGKCGLREEDKDYAHSDEECEVCQVMLS